MSPPDPITAQVVDELARRDDRVIVYDEVELGYCINCRRPSTVIRLLVRPWKHVVPICGHCLEGFAQLLRYEVPREPGDPRR